MKMICKYCGDNFTGRSNQKYCSRECCQAADRDNKRINYVGKREKTCRQCGQPLPKFKTKFCSERCSLIYNNVILDHGELTKTCPVCGKEFKTWRSQKITCSEACSKKRDQIKYALDPEKERKKDRERYRAKHPDAKTMEQIHEDHLARLKRIEAEKAIRQQEREKEWQKNREKKAKIKQQKRAYWQEYCKMHTCKVCGQMYVAYYPLSEYCSDKCRRKRFKVKKRYKGITVDKDITLKMLAKKDSDTCKICGFKVDWDDWIQKDGTIICGDYYPSIDHIRPISKGGMHSWDNVQLAHRKCNTLKNDKVIS